METDLVDFTTFEAIFLREEIGFEEAIDSSLNFVSQKPFGLELDCDSIQSFPSSAQTPSGISANQARFYIHQAASNENSIYLHLPEAAPSIVQNSSEQVGKLLAYFVSDFIRAKS
jgi:formiminoglutamase